MGFRDRLGPGDAQFIHAGCGILHTKQSLSGRQGLQLKSMRKPDSRFTSTRPGRGKRPASACRRSGLTEQRHPDSHGRTGR